MASIFLDWREAQNGNLPMVCATCGDRATEMVERRLTTVGPGVMVIIRTKVRVWLPYCPRHVVASWNGWIRVRALSIRKDGIKLGQVSSDFVDAVHEYRADPTRFRRKRSPNEEDRPRRDPGDSSQMVTVIVLVIVFTAILMVCGFGLLFFNLVRPGIVPRPGQPGLNPQGPLAPPVGPQRPPFRR